MTRLLANSRRVIEAAHAHRNWTRFGFLLYGIVLVAAAIVHAHTSVAEPSLMGSRVSGIHDAIRVLDEGGPPLLGHDPSFQAGAPPGTPEYDRLPLAEPPGIYLYLSELGHLSGTADPSLLLKWFLVGMMAPIVIIFPLVFFELFSSVAAGLIAPLLLLWRFRLLEQSDIYWISEWVLLLCLPLTFLIDRRWGRHSILWLALLMIPASIATSIRFYSGLPVLLAALIVIVRHCARWRRRAVAAGVVVGAYLLISPLAFGAVTKYRDHHLPGPTAAQRVFSPWHSIYIGLGYLDNSYGIAYKDEVAYAAALRADPKVTYLGPGYGAAVRSEFFRIAKHDPWFVVRNVTAKVRAVFHDAIARFLAVLVLVPLMCSVSTRRREFQRWLLLTTPALLLGVLPPVVVIPHIEYEMEWLGAWGVLWLLGTTWAVASVASLADGRPRPAARVGRRAAQVSALVAVAAATLAALPEPAAVARAARTNFYILNASLLVDPATPSGQLAAHWQFRSDSLAGWSRIGSARTRVSGNGMTVQTTPGAQAYQLESPTQTLPAGQYEVTVSGRPLSGGILVGALDTRSQQWLGVGDYWSGQKGFDKLRMAALFDLSSPASVKILLANFRPQNGSSRWIIREVRLYRRPGSAS